MSATTDLALYRLGAVGAIPVNLPVSDPRYERAVALVEMAAEQVLAHINMTDSAVALLSSQLRGVIATAVAETASARLQRPAAPSTDEYVLPDGMVSAIMPARVIRMLNRYFSPLGNAPTSMVVLRDEATSYLRPFPV